MSKRHYDVINTDRWTWICGRNARAYSGNRLPAAVTLAPGSVAGDVWSRGPVDLLPGSRVEGTLYAEHVMSRKGSHVGKVVTNPPFDPVNAVSWTVRFPVAAARDVTVRPGETISLKPGRFRSAVVLPRATLRLAQGTFFFESLILDPGSRLVLVGGPAIIYVRKFMRWSGEVEPSVVGPASTDLLVGYLGAPKLTLHSAFRGVLVAPSAEVKLLAAPALHRGAFFASAIELGPGAKVEHSPPLVLLIAAPPTEPGLCADRIPFRDDLSGRDRDLAFQRDVALYCSAKDESSCVAYLVGRANLDYSAAAARVASGLFSPALYLALSRDRTRKLNAARDQPGQATLLCASRGSDDDFVPDPIDRCPGTIDLTATDDSGCTQATQPGGPSSADVRTLLGMWGMLINPTCNDAEVPQQIATGAFYYPDNTSAGTYLIVGRVSSQPTGCPVWYLIDIQEIDKLTGAATGARYSVVFKQSDQSADLIGLPSTPVPGEFIQFNPHPTDVGNRGRLGTPNPSIKLLFRAQAMNARGERGQWSDWKLTSQSDCIALGFTCRE